MPSEGLRPVFRRHSTVTSNNMLSEIKAAFYAGCFRIVGLYGFGFDDDDRFGRNIIMVAVTFGGYAFDGIDHVKTAD